MKSTDSSVLPAGNVTDIKNQSSPKLITTPSVANAQDLQRNSTYHMHDNGRGLSQHMIFKYICSLSKYDILVVLSPEI